MSDLNGSESWVLIVGERFANRKSMKEKIDKNILKLFERKMKVDDGRFTKMVHEAEVDESESVGDNKGGQINEFKSFFNK